MSVIIGHDLTQLHLCRLILSFNLHVSQCMWIYCHGMTTNYLRGMTSAVEYLLIGKSLLEWGLLLQKGVFKESKFFPVNIPYMGEQTFHSKRLLLALLSRRLSGELRVKADICHLSTF